MALKRLSSKFVPNRKKEDTLENVRDGPWKDKDGPAHQYSSVIAQSDAPREHALPPAPSPRRQEFPSASQPPAPSQSAPDKKAWNPLARRKQEREEYEQRIREQESLLRQQEWRYQEQLEKERRITERLRYEREEDLAMRKQLDEDRIKDSEHREQIQRQGEREVELKRMATSPQALQHLRKLVRERYYLDMEIWRMRKTRVSNRDMVEEKMARADALLKEIQAIVKSWPMGLDVWDDEENIETAQEIRERLANNDDKRNWTEHPPWEELDDRY